jgi:predicted RNase H-like nuclease (RuvC/YqgF family)
MMAQLGALLRIKELKEEQAFRVVNIKRREVADALAVLKAAHQRLVSSQATYAKREDAIYQKIMRRIVHFDELEGTKAKIQVLEKEHAKLADGVERATHVHERLTKQLSQAIAAYNVTIRERDKYTILTDEIGAGLRSEIAYREESEVEDLFSANRGRRP